MLQGSSNGVVKTRTLGTPELGMQHMASGFAPQVLPVRNSHAVVSNTPPIPLDEAIVKLAAPHNVLPVTPVEAFTDTIEVAPPSKKSPKKSKALVLVTPVKLPVEPVQVPVAPSRKNPEKKTKVKKITHGVFFQTSVAVESSKCEARPIESRQSVDVQRLSWRATASNCQGHQKLSPCAILHPSSCTERAGTCTLLVSRRVYLGHSNGAFLAFFSPTAP